MFSSRVQEIVKALSSIEGAGSFCAKRASSIGNLELNIAPIGSLKFPLKKSTIKSLIQLAKPARFGWRSETVLDKRVRNAWEINKKQIKINQKSWDLVLRPMLEQLKSDLGYPERAKLEASLHNLLIYEPGQFFSPHQDSEKEPGMVASLVIILPSIHTGGTLVIDQQGTQKSFQSSRFALDQLTFIAFYADCHHEIKAIKSGYRVALTYNLSLKMSEVEPASTEQLKSYKPLIQSLKYYFEAPLDAVKSRYENRGPRKWVYLLDHDYTQKSLAWNTLKNNDRLRGEGLKIAAEALNLRSRHGELRPEGAPARSASPR